MLYRGKHLYEKKRNGKIEQWGKVKPTDNTPRTTAFPITFSSIPDVFAKPQNNKNDMAWLIQYHVRIESVTINNFVNRSYRTGGASTADDDTEFAWFAIGN